MNTGLTLRTIRMKDGLAEIRAGATLLFDSDPEAEEAECRLKASALLGDGPRRASGAGRRALPSFSGGKGRKVLLVDHEDSFVHTLAELHPHDRRRGHHDASRHGPRRIARRRAPGPGRACRPVPAGPTISARPKRSGLLVERNIPVFGVCLGLQAMVEYFGGALDVLDIPMHGKPSPVRLVGESLLSGLGDNFTVGRYHSLYARRSTLPPMLRVTAETDDGVIMGIEHESLPMAAVQFHPELVMTLAGAVGLPILDAVFAALCRGRNDPG